MLTGTLSPPHKARRVTDLLGLLAGTLRRNHHVEKTVKREEVGVIKVVIVQENRAKSIKRCTSYYKLS
jgi:hypothetical protein